jgi:H+-transporting ATPase
VVLTAAGSMTVLAGAVMTPGVSQLMGCTPLGPVGWSQALGAATLATAGAAVVPVITDWFSAPTTGIGVSASPVADTSLNRQSTMSTTPARHNTAYSSRNGSANNRATAAVNGSAPGPLVGSDTP